MPQPPKLTLPPLSLYIHLPWCVSKCPYCDFNSHVAKEPIAEMRYINALIADLECDLPYVQNRPLHSVFIGGGTPSLFSADAVASLLERIDQRIAIPPGCEITLEANPESADLSKLEALYQVGINRLSLGIQSLADQSLTLIGRAHNAKQALNAYTNARQAGFSNINCDLMFGLPKQTKQQALADLSGIIELKPEHISWYQLTIEANTFFYSHRPQLPDDDTLWRLQSEGIALLQSHGYRHYEVSAYSQSKPCQHNLNYWRFGDYLGIGAGACGKITQTADYRIIRTRKHRQPEHYIARAKTGNCCVELYEVKKSERSFEFLLNALRLTEGFEKSLFSRTGLDQTLAQQLAPFIDKGWIISDRQRFRPSAEGMRYLNEVLEYYLPDKDNQQVYTQIVELSQ